MLNESFELNVSMESARISRVSWHKHYKECPTNTKSFFLFLSEKGDPCQLELIKDPEKIRSMRKYEVSNGVSFPGFNIQPLWYAGNDEAKEAAKRLKEIAKAEPHDRGETELVTLFNTLWEQSESLWTASEVTRIKKCLQGAGLKEKISHVMGNIPENYKAFLELMERSAELNVADLEGGLRSIVLDRVLASRDADEWIDALLVSTAKHTRSIKKVSVVLELDDRSAFLFPSNHSTVSGWINKILMEQPTARPVEISGSDLDAFGLPIVQRDSKETFPAMNLPVLGKVILRAMSSEIPCQRRYGRIDANSFPASGVVRQTMKDALEWLCREARKGKTWAKASGVCGFTKGDGKKAPIPGLFLVYPSSLGEDPPELAGAFFRTDEALDQDGAKFESAATRVTSALQLRMASQPALEVRVFVLTKPDGHRTKVLVSKKYNTKTLISGAQDWWDGCKNIPFISLNIGSNDNPIWIKPVIPFPAEVVRCLNVAWLQVGTRTDNVHGLGIGEGVALLLETGLPLRAIVQRAISLVTTNAKPLLLALGHADHRRDGSNKLDSKYASLMPSILGLLLHKQNLAKGVYMHTAPFLVGRLLALADLLHKEYCVHVRNGDVPPQLIGNALMSSAIDNPVRGLARLRERLMIYQAWANKIQGDDFRLAKWSLKEMGSVCNRLSKLNLPDRTDDADKVQMLLGYLARSEDKASQDDNSSALNSEREVSNVRS